MFFVKERCVGGILFFNAMMFQENSGVRQPKLGVHQGVIAVGGFRARRQTKVDYASWRA